MEARNLWVNLNDLSDVVTTEDFLSIPMGERYPFTNLENVVARANMSERIHAVLAKVIDYSHRCTDSDSHTRLEKLVSEWNELVKEAVLVSGDYARHRTFENNDHLAKVVKYLAEISTDIRRIRHKMELMKR